MLVENFISVTPCIENVAGFDFFEQFTYQLLHKEYLIVLFKRCHFCVTK